MKVLVVDDDVVSRMVLMHLIDAMQGYDVAEAEDGQDAWEQLAAGLRPAVCFCDMRMPRLSGMELLQRIKADPALRSTHVVMVSSANEAHIVEAATSQGAAGYIIKPFNGEQVRSHLARLQQSGTEVLTDAPAEAPAGAPASEAPRDTLQRLGIGTERLLAYLGGFDKQLAQAAADLPRLLKDSPAEARVRIERLVTGSRTLGLHGAVASLDGLQSFGAPDAMAVERALHTTAAAVAAQLDAVRRLHADA